MWNVILRKTLSILVNRDSRSIQAIGIIQLRVFFYTKTQKKRMRHKVGVKVAVISRALKSQRKWIKKTRNNQPDLNFILRSAREANSSQHNGGSASFKPLGKLLPRGSKGTLIPAQPRLIVTGITEVLRRTSDINIYSYIYMF